MTIPRYVGERISRKLLPRVRAPSQYIGLEINARCMDPAAAEVTVALAFPAAGGAGSD